MTKREKQLVEACTLMLDATTGSMLPSDADAIVMKVITMLRILTQ